MATSPLKVIALISGGKDSLFSILHCLANGHEIVALANLYPPTLPGGGQQQRDDDIDSFMYQTIGHNVIPLYAGALGIPLFREEIMGSAVDSGREYGLGENRDDETENLVPLLERCVRETGANAVSTGAILSTYQRTRVEAIAVRLGLTPLSYLWQYLYLPPYTQASLLDDMRNVGQDARIIKVASGGLDESFLWEDVAAQKTIARMKRRMEMFGGGAGGAVIGEGGEFETLALDGPASLWKQSIEIAEVKKMAGEGGSASAQLVGAKLVPKAAANASEEEQLRIPPLLDAEFEQVLDHLKTSSPWQPSKGDNLAGPLFNRPTGVIIDRKTAQDISSLNPSTIRIANMMPSRDNTMGQPMTNTKDQMIDLMNGVQYKLFQLELSFLDVIHTTIRLRDMSSFAEVNTVYSSYFRFPNPPSRVTISCGELMPKGVDIMLGTEAGKAGYQSQREALHVQSRSYWAPANIGPYSQAVSILLISKGTKDDATIAHARLVHVAGQIPLKPASMDIVTASDLGMSGATAIQACAICKTTSHLQRCTMCKSIKYCSKECQKKDWKAHKVVCASLRDSKEEDPLSAIPAPSQVSTGTDSRLRPDGDDDIALPVELREFAAQSVLSLQHLWRIGRAMNVTAWIGAVAVLSRSGTSEAVKKAHLACDTWHRIHEIIRNIGTAPDDDDESEEPDERDAWDIANGVSRLQTSGKEKDTRLPLPDFSKIKGDKVSNAMLHPPVFAAEVQSLPRDAMIEWCSTGVAATDQQIEYAVNGHGSGWTSYDCIVHTSKRSKTVVEYVTFADASGLDTYVQLVDDRYKYDAMTVYTTKALPDVFWRVFPKAMVIPCFRLWSRDEKEGVRDIEALLTMRCDTYDDRDFMYENDGDSE